MRKISFILTLNIILLVSTPIGYLALIPGIVLNVILGVYQMLIFGYLLWELRQLSTLIHKLLAAYGIGLLFTTVIAIISLDDYGLTAWLASCILAIFFTAILVAINTQTSIKQKDDEI